MSYQVLARKWRPRLFGELVGQEHVVRALTNALDHDRLHHAYLFTGTRGVGKTTLARIFAKSLNCEQGVTSVPCGQCSVCTEIDEGRFVDLLEVDAASRTKVDQTRELLDNVPYAPVRGRYKVYLIDEVHMFSDSSFNALLKTLEEPPPHVKFLLATTDPQKVPVTVLSRCLQFNLKRLPLDQIQGRLEQILQQESVEHDVSALLQLARAADGSMRDALSLMDQAIAFGGGDVREEDVRTMLGTIAGEQVFHLLDALADLDPQRVVDSVAELAERVPDFANVLQELLSMLHRIALYQAVPKALEVTDGDHAQIDTLAQKIAPEDVQLFYQIGLVGQRDLPLAPDPRSGFEMVLLRMLAFRPEQGVGRQTGNSGQKPATTAAKAAPVAAAPGPVTAPSQVSQPKRVVEAAATGTTADLKDWNRVISGLKLGGISRQLAANCQYREWDGTSLTLILDPAHEHMRVEGSEHRLVLALQEYLGREVKLKILVEQPESETPAQQQARSKAERQREAEHSMSDDPMVRAAQEQFGATLITESVKPID
ncbi:MAG: DNA polymerase III subunit gamma/tau [Gammaproteobacteria bacterium]|nr:DNA polymerase III subunit gamma/tau [Gammaproteobacteria bacterium]